MARSGTRPVASGSPLGCLVAAAREGSLAAVPSPRPSRLVAVPLEEVRGIAGGTLDILETGEPAGLVVTGVSLDSRSIRPGDLYAALPGYHAHGATFAAQAVATGAVALLTDPDGARIIREDVEHARAGETQPRPLPTIVCASPREILGAVAARIYGRPADHLALVGITGTNGKTTTAYLVESGLRHLGVTTGLIGTVETRLGSRRLPSARTTPEATDLHAILAMMLEEGSTAAVMEVSSHALRQHRVDGAVFDVALFTNLSQDHLDFHPTMEDYFAAKALLFTPAHSSRGLVCVDDAWGARLAAQATVPVETLTSRPDTAANWVVRQRDWPHFTLDGPAGRLELECHLPGEFNVVNTAMAAVALLTLGSFGHDAIAVRSAMAREPVVPGRMERVTATSPDGEDPRAIVDYAHTPDAVAAALQALRPTTAGRLVVVLGAGGDRDRGKRPAMGAAAARWADDVIITDDNPRSEDPAAIRAEVEAGADRVGAVAAVRSNTAGRFTAIAQALAIARSATPSRDNTVLILGKGHESGQDVAGTVHAFDDRDALRAALDGTAYTPEDGG